MTLEQMLQLKPGDKVSVNFKLSSGNSMIKKCTVRHIVKPKDRNPFAFVVTDNCFSGTMLPAKPEQITLLHNN